MITNSRGMLQIPCTETRNPPNLKQAKQSNKIYKAIGLTSSIWKKEGGIINVTFGSYKYPNEPNVSPFAAWSYVGSQVNNTIPGMNLGFIDPPFESFEYDGVLYNPDSYATRNYCGINGNCDPKWEPGATVIHEFCHAFGMLHEHQNNLNNMSTLKTSLDKNKVIQYYSDLDPKDPNPTATATANVLDYYENAAGDDTYIGTKYDPNSIMHYALPDEWFKGYINGVKFKNPTSPNFILSTDDIDWLKERYPVGDPSTYPIITIKFIDTFGAGAKQAFRDEITSKYENECSDNKTGVCKEIKEMFTNINQLANSEVRWKTENDWKKAWVQKTVLDTFSLIIGIKFVFQGPTGVVIRNVISDNIYTQPAPNPNEDSSVAYNPDPVNVPTVNNQIVHNSNSLEIASGVLGTIVGLGLLIGIIALIYKSIGSDGIGSRNSGTYFTLKKQCM